MEVLSNESFPKRDRSALIRFLEHCRSRSRAEKTPIYGSISLRVQHIDPLAVLAAIQEPGLPHLFIESPSSEFALASAEVVERFEASGPGRFRLIRAQVDRVLASTVAIGDLDAPFAGPCFSTAFCFSDQPSTGCSFAPAVAFLPRWQVSLCNGSYTAVANVRVHAESEIDVVADRILAAHARFAEFEYGRLPGACSGSLGCPKVASGPQEVGRDYAEAVRAALREIRTGQLSKVVLSRAVDVSFDAAVPALGWIAALRERFPSCHSLCFRDTGSPSFVAATPERLLRVSGGELETDAIAGTASRGQGFNEDAVQGKWLLSSPKNRAEHAAVVDAIVGSLSRLGIEARPSSGPRLMKLPNALHLRTPIGARVGGDVSFLELAEALHPTPAVGGWPRDRSLELIADLEDFDRGLFAGAIGWFDWRGDGELLVGLRCACVNGNSLRFYAGAGIVEGSDPRQELRETNIKLGALMDSLGVCVVC